jgi:hypothetical protein
MPRARVLVSIGTPLWRELDGWVAADECRDRSALILLAKAGRWR